MPLTDTTIRKVKPEKKIKRLFDGGGLYLELRPSGAKYWRMKYRRPGTGKENRLAFGVYPDVTLKMAREKRDEARRLLGNGVDPATTCAT